MIPLYAQRSAGGAEAVIGGGRNRSIQNGVFYEPTILTDVRPEMDAIKERNFGPVLTVETFDDDQEAISKASHPVYGLSAGLYTANMSKALTHMRALEAGTVWINRYGRTNDFMIPTGGFKQSGIGKDLGRQAVEQNLRFKERADRSSMKQIMSTGIVEVDCHCSMSNECVLKSVAIFNA